MSGNKIIKSVSFNITNEEDVRMLKAIKRRNFSGYVKKLILADIQAKSEKKEDQEPIEKSGSEEKLTAAERLTLLKQRNGHKPDSNNVNQADS